MLRRFLTKEQREQLDRDCLAYKQWREWRDSQQSEPLAEESVEGKIVVENSFNENAAKNAKHREKVSDDIRYSSVSSNKTIKDKRQITFQSPENSRPSSADSSKFKKQKVLSVEEIFAKGLREWREQEEAFKNSPFYRENQGGKTETSSGANRHPVREELRRKKQEEAAAARAAKAAKNEEEEEKKESDDDEFEETETESESKISMTEDYRRKLRRNLDIFTDIIKLLVVFGLSMCLTSLPMWYIASDEFPEEVTIHNLTEHNICFWGGSPGLMANDPPNPCPYRGYVSNDKHGKECMIWKLAIDGGKEGAVEFPDIGVDGIEYLSSGADHSYAIHDLRKWRKAFRVLHGLERSNETLDPYLKTVAKDYGYRFCRRLGNNPQNNFGVCLIRNEKEKIALSYCWLIPCTIDVSSHCFGKYYNATHSIKSSSEPPPTTEESEDLSGVEGKREEL